jgi:hypothetical protein
MIDRVGGRHTLEGLVVDPIEGVFPGALVVEDGLVAEVRRIAGGVEEPLIFPGFIDLQVYDPAGLGSTGVTGYLLATRTVQEVDDPLCLGLHLEGPFLNPEAAGAIPVEELTPVDLGAVEEWTSAPELVRLVTLAPEEIPKGYISLRSAGNNVFETINPVSAGTRFKMEIKNSTECYVYVFGKETDGTSYTLFPYPRNDDPSKTKYSPFCGITGYRLFPKDKSMMPDSIGTNDLPCRPTAPINRSITNATRAR